MKAFCSREVPGTVEINVKKWAERKPCVITVIVIVEVFVSCIILREEPGTGVAQPVQCLTTYWTTRVPRFDP
jgi:hypothetical protein